MAYTDTLAVQNKEFSYKVYTQAGTYIGEWTDVADDLEFTQPINTPGTTTTVRLARSARSTQEARDLLITEAGDFLITEDGHNLVAVYETTNSIGSGTDVDLNHFVDIYVAYGGLEPLYTQAGEKIITEAGEDLLWPLGAPLGTRVFSGYIVDYEFAYSGDGENIVTVTLMSNGAELSQELIKSGTATTVTYATTDHGNAIKNILDQNTGKMDYVGSSVGLTGVATTTFTFRRNTFLEGIESIYDQSPSGWYWYGNPADNTVYFRQKSPTPDHTFVLGQHIKELKLKKTIENLITEVDFVGGEVAAVPVYRKYTTTSTITRKGIDRHSDRRYTLADSIQKYAAKKFAKFSEPVYTTSVTILSTVYEIENIQLGQVVAFENFGTFVDSLQLQIVSRKYTPTSVTLQLGEMLDRQMDTLGDVEEALLDEQSVNVPTTPS